MTAHAPEPVPLAGDVVRLDPMRDTDAGELFTALDDERVWASFYGGGPAGRPKDVAGMRAFLSGSLDRAARGEHLPYTVRLAADGTVVGTTSLGDIDLTNERIHLGWTAYAPAVWGGAVNPECKLLLLGHAFASGFGRVKLQTDGLNPRSQAAIAKLGATREGVLRRHVKRADGTFRDSVVFSILADEWPAVSDGLRARVAKAR